MKNVLKCDVCRAKLASFAGRTRCLLCTDEVGRLRVSFATRLVAALKASGMSAADVAADFAASEPTFKRWLQGVSRPRGDVYERAEAFISTHGGERMPAAAMGDSR
mgnify:CR=1 FL=1